MAYQEPITKNKLLKFINAYSMVDIIAVENDEPIFVLKNMPNFEDQHTFFNQRIIIHRGKFIWKNDTNVPLTPQAEAYFNGRGGYYLDEYETYHDYPKQITEYVYKEFSIHRILLDAEIRKDKKYVKPLLDLLRHYGILKKTKGKAEKSMHVKDAIEFLGREANNRKYAIKITGKEILIPYAEYLLLLFLAMKRKNTIHNNGWVTAEAIEKKKIVTDLTHLHHLVSNLKKFITKEDLIENMSRASKYRLSTTLCIIKIPYPKWLGQEFRKIKDKVLEEREGREKAKDKTEKAFKSVPD